MAVNNDIWAKKWRELRKLVNQKYSGYIALIGLEMKQFQELEGTQVCLLIRHCSLLLGAGDSRLEAINMALRTLKADEELVPLPIFTQRVATKRETREVTRIIKQCVNPKPE